ncbi:MAG: hypothetical protein IIB69_13885 [Proteobacteria bacterium]|nr:hypothetical protein [Pseudomonadota bacterium]
MFENLLYLTATEFIVGVIAIIILLNDPARVHAFSTTTKEIIVMVVLFFMLSGLHNLILLGIYGLAGGAIG